MCRSRLSPNNLDAAPVTRSPARCAVSLRAVNDKRSVPHVQRNRRPQRVALEHHLASPQVDHKSDPEIPIVPRHKGLVTAARSSGNDGCVTVKKYPNPVCSKDTNRLSGSAVR